MAQIICSCCKQRGPMRTTTTEKQPKTNKQTKPTASQNALSFMPGSERFYCTTTGLVMLSSPLFQRHLFILTEGGQPATWQPDTPLRSEMLVRSFQPQFCPIPLLCLHFSLVFSASLLPFFHLTKDHLSEVHVIAGRV